VTRGESTVALPVLFYGQAALLWSIKAGGALEQKGRLLASGLSTLQQVDLTLIFQHVENPSKRKESS
jgi:hypothetical protein